MNINNAELKGNYVNGSNNAYNQQYNNQQYYNQQYSNNQYQYQNNNNGSTTRSINEYWIFKKYWMYDVYFINFSLFIL